uniref:CUE domain-containing protein n=1 Tax=Strigamia maritima TaxID=126957 RepID=T1IM07_STRMM
MAAGPPARKFVIDPNNLWTMAAVDQPPSQDEPPAPPNATQLEFSQAMHDFKTMFPEMDEDVIEAVLRANQGAVDATIDQLLTMSIDNENERLRTEMDAADNAESPPSYSPTTPPPSYQQAVPNVNTPPLSPKVSIGKEAESAENCAANVAPEANVDLLGFSSLDKNRLLIMEEPDEVAAVVEAASGPLRSARNWRPMMLGSLPADFLRVAGEKKRTQHRELTAVLSSEIIQRKIEENARQQRRLSAGDCDPELARYLEDERVALLLQNEEFVQELRRNKDFMSTLERDTDEDVEKVSGEAAGPYPYTKTFPSEDSDAAFREKLKNMGKMSRRKFAQLARIFSRRKKRSAKQILSDGAVPSKDNLLLEDDDDEDEDESGDEIAVKGSVDGEFEARDSMLHTTSGKSTGSTA